MNYKQQLKDPRWLKKRLEIIDRDKKCQMCGRVGMFEIHHLRYIRGHKAWQYSNDDLILLCNVCHQKETKNRILLNKLIDGMLLAGIFSHEIIEKIKI